MKSKKYPHAAPTALTAILFFLLPALILSSCVPSAADTRLTGRLSIPFTCRISGKVSGKDFTARLSSDGKLVYEAPSALAEIAVILTPNGSVDKNEPTAPDGALSGAETVADPDASSCTVSLGSLSLPGDRLKGLAAPLFLLLCRYEETADGADVKNGLTVRFQSGINRHGDRKIRFSQDGVPLSATGTVDGITVEFEITDWQ